MFHFDFKSVDLYGPGKTYHKLTGKDASRAIAKWSLEPNNLNGEIVSKILLRISKLFFYD